MSEVGRIEGIMATAYDECSLAAAAANRTAHEIVRNRRNSNNTSLEILEHPFDTPGIMTETRVVELTNGYLLEHGESPRLLSTVCHDLVIPVARFALRTGTECSYVQLGSEMHEDNIVVTPKDQRQHIIDSIRTLFRNNVNHSALNEFTNETKSRIEDEINLRIPGTLSRWLKRSYDASKRQKREFFVVSADDDPEQLHQMETVELSVSAFGFNGYQINERSLTFHIGKSRTDGSDSLLIMIVTRNDVAVPLAVINRDGIWSFPNEEDFSAEEKYKAIRLVATAVEAESLRKNKLKKLVGEKLLKKSAKEIDDFYNGIRQKPLHAKDLKNALNPLIENGVYIGSESIRHSSSNRPAKFESGIVQPTTGFKVMATKLRVSDTIDALLGPTSADTEAVISKLESLAGGRSSNLTKSGVLKDRQVGTTSIDIAVDMTVRRCMNGAAYLIHIAGKPAAQQGVEPVPIFNGTVHRTKPSDFTLEDFKEIHTVIQAVDKK